MFKLEECMNKLIAGHLLNSSKVGGCYVDRNCLFKS